MPLESLQVAGRSFQLQLPDPERMLDEAVAGEATGSPGWDPYWGLLWAASPLTASRSSCRLLRDVAAPLNWGAGLGSPASPQWPPGSTSRFRTSRLQLCRWPRTMQHEMDFRTHRDWFLDGSSRRWIQGPGTCSSAATFCTTAVLIVRCSRRFSSCWPPGGIVWIGDAGRANAAVFAESATAVGWNVRLYDQRLLPTRSFEQLQFRLLVLERSSRI
ncbi:MAG UNVERIFIED_CONTAM: hypothetical protein LVR18_47045 [Planctomycetaceae bacterium]